MKSRPQRAKGPGVELSAFENFQALARRLFAVPKKEIDEKLAEYQAQKRKRRKPQHA